MGLRCGPGGVTAPPRRSRVRSGRRRRLVKGLSGREDRCKGAGTSLGVAWVLADGRFNGTRAAVEAWKHGVLTATSPCTLAGVCSSKETDHALLADTGTCPAGWTIQARCRVVSERAPVLCSHGARCLPSGKTRCWIPLRRWRQIACPKLSPEQRHTVPAPHLT